MKNKNIRIIQTYVVITVKRSGFLHAMMNEGALFGRQILTDRSKYSSPSACNEDAVEC